MALSSGNFPLYFFPAAYIRGLISGGGGYIRGLISGRLVSSGLISEGLTYPGAYIQRHISRWLISGDLYPGAYNPELISGGLLSWELLPGGLYPGGNNVIRSPGRETCFSVPRNYLSNWHPTTY